MICVLDPGRTDPNGKPEEASPTGRWYLLDGVLWVEMDYGYMFYPEFKYKDKQILFFSWRVKDGGTITRKPLSRRFFNENEIIEVNP